MIIPQKKHIYIPILLLALALVLSSCASLPWVSTTPEPTPLPEVLTEGVVSAEGRVVPLRFTNLGFPTGGEIGELSIAEGDAVSQGALLARLARTEPLKAALTQAQFEELSAQQALDELNRTAALSRQQANQALVEAKAAYNRTLIALDDLDTEDFQTELDDHNTAVQDAKDRLDEAQKDLDRYLDRDPENTTRKYFQSVYDDAKREYDRAIYDRDQLQYQLDQAHAAVDLASARLAEAQRQVDNRSSGIDQNVLALALARVDAAKAQVSAAQRALDNASLTAPYAGIIVDLNDFQVGETILPNQALLTLADDSTWLVETRDLNELDVVKVKVGQSVEVTPDALPDLKLKGTVESIDSAFTERAGDILYTVRIHLSDTDPRLRWGMTVNAVFE